jgi:hypothetical protein
MGRDPLEELVDIVERVAANRIVQRADIRGLRIRINSCGVRHGKTGGIEENVVADIVEVAEGRRWRPSQSNASRRSNRIRRSASHIAVCVPHSSLSLS